MDEPTAALSHREAADLFEITRRIRQQGCAVLFISHKFEEIFAIADRFAVFRDGVSVGEGSIRETNPGQLIRLMVGREVAQIYPESESTAGNIVLSLRGVGCAASGVRDVTFDEDRSRVRRGAPLAAPAPCVNLAGHPREQRPLYGRARAAAGSSSAADT